MEGESVKAFFSQDGVVRYYAMAVDRVGLWRSEEFLLTRIFGTGQRILELGCGAGRISFALHALGYRDLLPTDYSPQMVEMATHIALEKGVDLPFAVADACDLPYGDAEFDGAIFGFNGLMQIPKLERRMRAMCEVARVLKPGSHFFFTSHDRAHAKRRRQWQDEQRNWETGQQHPGCERFGDCIGATEWGEMFIHVPLREEVTIQLESAGFRVLSCERRSDLMMEDQATRDFADECLLWVATRR